MEPVFLTFSFLRLHRGIYSALLRNCNQIFQDKERRILNWLKKKKDYKKYVIKCAVYKIVVIIFVIAYDIRHYLIYQSLALVGHLTLEICDGRINVKDLNFVLIN